MSTFLKTINDKDNFFLIVSIKIQIVFTKPESIKDKGSCLEISIGFIYEQPNLMYKVSHLARAHCKVLKDQLRMSLVLLSNHETLQHNINTEGYHFFFNKIKVLTLEQNVASLKEFEVSM